MVREKKSVQDEVGKGTEKFIAKTFRNFGYWAYNIPKKTEGQPCDIVAIKGCKHSEKTISWLVDAKHVRENEVSFPFSRIEPNQITAMAYAKQYAKIKNVGFAIFFERTKKLYWFPYDDYIRYSQLNAVSVNMNELEIMESVLRNEDDH